MLSTLQLLSSHISLTIEQRDISVVCWTIFVAFGGTIEHTETYDKIHDQFQHEAFTSGLKKLTPFSEMTGIDRTHT